jgi:hypothetical protein
MTAIIEIIIATIILVITIIIMSRPTKVSIVETPLWRLLAAVPRAHSAHVKVYQRRF